MDSVDECSPGINYCDNVLDPPPRTVGTPQRNFCEDKPDGSPCKYFCRGQGCTVAEGAACKGGLCNRVNSGDKQNEEPSKEINTTTTTTTTITTTTKEPEPIETCQDKQCFTTNYISRRCVTKSGKCLCVNGAEPPICSDCPHGFPFRECG